jgi:hypothetical protein
MTTTQVSHEYWCHANTGVYAIKSVYTNAQGNKVEKYQSWYRNGNPRSLYQRKDGEIHGRFTQWNNNETHSIDCDIFYEDGELHGRRRLWLPTGILLCDSHHRRGRLHGLDRGWDFDGNLTYTLSFCIGYDLDSVKLAWKYLRKWRWFKVIRLVRSRPFVEWWYNPRQTGGKLSKKRIAAAIDF